MSLLLVVVVSVLVLGYVLFVMFVLALLRAAKRADEEVELERRALVPRRVEVEPDPALELVMRRRAG